MTYWNCGEAILQKNPVFYNVHVESNAIHGGVAYHQVFEGKRISLPESEIATGCDRHAR